MIIIILILAFAGLKGFGSEPLIMSPSFAAYQGGAGTRSLDPPSGCSCHSSTSHLIDTRAILQHKTQTAFLCDCSIIEKKMPIDHLPLFQENYHIKIMKYVQRTLLWIHNNQKWSLISFLNSFIHLFKLF